MAARELRFRDLVAASGTPEVVSLWTDPRQDPTFMKAVRENRVLTVTQPTGANKRDSGRIGFHESAHAAYFIFPQPLVRNLDSRVVGIKYNLLRQRRPGAPDRPRGPELRSAPQPRAKPESIFHFIVQRQAVLETTVQVSARTKAEAERKALHTAKQEPFDLAKAILNIRLRPGTPSKSKQP